VIIFAGLAAVAAVVALLGGRLSALGSLTVRARAAILGALVLQVVVVTIAPHAFPLAVARVLHLVSYALAVAFLWANRRLPWMWVAAVGGACNLAAIVANGGAMPASRAASTSAGIATTPGDFANSAALAHPRLAFLGDVFAIPKGWPFANVFSIGDAVLLAGAAALLVAVCGVPRLRPAESPEFQTIGTHSVE
jgi:hypothetical protein